ncbi:hypothetical protein F4811DRAFT_82109 [Daldinia bambusicola]|nr:hypothetical protein F4811DRAFT_82109 [Daldinia bambusicola]
MASKARKVPGEKWKLHKDTILRLFLTSDLSVGELVQTMEKDHKFTATLAQYEAQLRAWKARKNLKRDEWELILPKVDEISSRGIQTRVVIAGHPVPAKRIERARRYFRRDTERPRKRRRIEDGPGEAANNADRSAAIEVQNPGGHWTLYEDVVDGNIPSRPQPFNAIDTFASAEQEVQVEGDLTQLAPHSFFIETPPFLDISLGPLSPISSSFAAHDQPLNAEDQRFSHITDFQSQVTQPLMGFESDIDVTDSTSGSENSDLQLNNATQISLWPIFLEDLPFERFGRGLLSKCLRSMRSPPPIGDCRLLSGTETPAMKFFFQAVTAMTSVNGKSANENLVSAKFIFRILDTTLPDSRLHRETNNATSLSQRNPEIEICRIFLYSVANGFSGMEGMPAEVISKFLEQNCNIIKLLPQLSQNSSSYVAKSLAESLFRLCVESGNRTAIRLILRTGLVDVNEICCFVNGKKYTPMERLAQLQELQVIHELLQFKADTNRTYSKVTPEMKYLHISGALGHLIHGLVLKYPGKRIHSAFT